jgi:hypothetical protein
VAASAAASGMKHRASAKALRGRNMRGLVSGGKGM